jgi:hypothetical protein
VVRRSMAAAGVLAALVIGAPAPTQAHNVSLGTTISRAKLPRAPVEPGNRVIVFGRIGAVDQVCKALVSVELLRRVPGPDRVLEADTTDANGEYSFLRRPRGDQRVYVRFEGITDIITGHSHVCGATVSRELRLNVRG